jgi:hypothetical protein
MPITSTPAAAEGMPAFSLPLTGAVRRFLNRCRAASIAFRHCGDGHAFSVIYERTGRPEDDDGNPSHCFDVPTLERAIEKKEGTKAFLSEVGCCCNNPRVVMVLGDLTEGSRQ